MAGNRTTAADLAGGGARQNLDSGSSGMAESLQQALLNGSVKFKKSKYDMPDNSNSDVGRDKAERALKKGGVKGPGGHIFGAPAQTEPNMDYNSTSPHDIPSVGAGAWSAAIHNFMKQQKPLPPRYELDNKNNNLKKSHGTDTVSNMIDELLNVVKK